MGEFLLVFILLGTVLGNPDEPAPAPASQQIVDFKNNTKGPIGILTTPAGASVEYLDATVTLNRRVLFNQYFVENIEHILRERIPERVVHSKGAGAFGYFEVTHDITKYCKADMFSKVGKRTPVAVRFSPAFSDRGTMDTSRDARGFAIKFYTEEGNWDLVMFNTPMFTIKDPILFTAFTHTQKRNPVTNLMDPNMYWDFITLNPESLHIFLLLLGDRGIPDGYRHMPGFPIHTYQVVNDKGESYFIRLHFLPDQGIKNLRSKRARQIGGVDPDYATRDLYNAIGRGNFPSWTVYFQILTIEEVNSAGFDVFDVTLVLPQNKFPLKPVGKLVLDKNPGNYHADVEQLAFNPANLIKGVLGAPDKLFEVRRLVYRSTQNYRLGVNHARIPVNCPISKAFTYNRDGRPPVNDNGGGSPNYYPDIFNGPVPYTDENRVELIEIYQDPPNIFPQATELYTNEMTKQERNRLVENIVYSLAPAIQEIKDKAVKLFGMIHPDLGNKVKQGLKANSTRDPYDDSNGPPPQS